MKDHKKSSSLKKTKSAQHPEFTIHGSGNIM